MKKSEQIVRQFREVFTKAPAHIFRAPGRVNLIGEHTDYNEGFVLPAAIDRCTCAAASRRSDRKVNVYSEHFRERVRFDMDDLRPLPGHWSNYVRGVARMLEEAGLRLSGADLFICSDIPLGAGLSSSAALEVAVASVFVRVEGSEMELPELARLCQRAENEFVGMRCGIMDQFVSCHAREGHAVLLDCRTLHYRVLPVSSRTRLVVCNTMVHHELASSEYNRRREECETGVRELKKHLNGIDALRDVRPEDLKRFTKHLSPRILKRCRHVVTENERVHKAAEALEKNDPETFGQHMWKSHESLRDDYEVSCPELDLMVELARENEGVYGARMTGGGFGGSTVNLVASNQVDVFKEKIARTYQSATGIAAEIYDFTPARGACEVK